MCTLSGNTSANIFYNSEKIAKDIPFHSFVNFWNNDEFVKHAVYTYKMNDTIMLTLKYKTALVPEKCIVGYVSRLIFTKIRIYRNEQIDKELKTRF